MDYMKIYQQWCSDPYFDDATKAELKAIENNKEEIEDRFYRQLEFGTGGLRGVIGAGTNRMFLGFVEFIERALRNADRLRQLIHGGFLHPQRDSAMPRFLQQCLAELLSLVIGKSQARASLNMTVSVYLVILYRASFWFARGVEKKSLIKRSAVLQKETTEFR